MSCVPLPWLVHQPTGLINSPVQKVAKYKAPAPGEISPTRFLQLIAQTASQRWRDGARGGGLVGWREGGAWCDACCCLGPGHNTNMHGTNPGPMHGTNSSPLLADLAPRASGHCWEKRLVHGRGLVAWLRPSDHFQPNAEDQSQRW